MQADKLFREAVRLAGENDLVAAESLCRNALAADAENVNMLALLGAILLKSNRPEEAEPLLLSAVGIEPMFAKPQEDLAVLYMQREDFSEAAARFRKAANLAPGQASLFHGLSFALHKQRRNPEALDAYRKYLELSSRPVTLADINALRELGDLQNARIECGRLLAREPQNHQAMRQMAQIAAEQGYAAEAERLLTQLVEQAPRAIVPIRDLARLCRDQHRFMDAIGWYRRALELAPEDAALHLALADSLSVVGQADAALDAYSTCYGLDEGMHQCLLGQGHCLRALGRGDDARAAYQRCGQQESLYADACWGLASMRGHSFKDDELERMQAYRNRQAISDHDAIRLDFAIARALEDRGSFDKAWQHYTAGNTLQRTLVHYDAVALETRIDWLIETYDKALCEQPDIQQHNGAIPIFIVGLPRSGSTLLEQVLASHSRVQATTELPYLDNIARRIHNTEGKSGTPIPLAEMDDAAWIALRKEYLALSAAHHGDQKRYFVDKLPDNFSNIGFIDKILPQAIVIDARRDPRDTCVANFRQLYAQGKDFSYDLLEAGERYLQYHRIMQHWNGVFPGRVLRVQYEDMVEDTEGQIRRLLGHCGLEWEDNCLDFHLTPRTVTTASSEQVREPIYTDSVGFWRYYQAHLTDLLEVLDPLLECSPARF
jgi:tetratricopeptide (TPR) repeat protein